MVNWKGISVHLTAVPSNAFLFAMCKVIRPKVQHLDHKEISMFLHGISRIQQLECDEWDNDQFYRRISTSVDQFGMRDVTTYLGSFALLECSPDDAVVGPLIERTVYFCSLAQDDRERVTSLDVASLLWSCGMFVYQPPHGFHLSKAKLDILVGCYQRLLPSSTAQHFTMAINGLSRLGHMDICESLWAQAKQIGMGMTDRLATAFVCGYKWQRNFDQAAEFFEKWRQNGMEHSGFFSICVRCVPQTGHRRIQIQDDGVGAICI